MHHLPTILILLLTLITLTTSHSLPTTNPSAIKDLVLPIYEDSDSLPTTEEKAEIINITPFPPPAPPIPGTRSASSSLRPPRAATLPLLVLNGVKEVSGAIVDWVQLSHVHGETSACSPVEPGLANENEDTAPTNKPREIQ